MTERQRDRDRERETETETERDRGVDTDSRFGTLFVSSGAKHGGRMAGSCRLGEGGGSNGG